MPELTKEERLARAMKLAESEQANDTEEVFEIIDEKDSKPLTKEERLARALGQSESKKKSPSQSVSSTEEPSLASSEQKKKQSSGTSEDRPSPLKSKEETVFGKDTPLTETSFSKMVKEQPKKTKEQVLAEKYSLTNLDPSIAAKKDVVKQQTPLDIQSDVRRLNTPKVKLKVTDEVQKKAFDGNVDQLLKQGFSEEEIEKAKKDYINKQVKQKRESDISNNISYINKFAYAPEDFKEAIGVNPSIMQQAKDMSFGEVRDLALSVSGIEDEDAKVVTQFSDLVNRLNAYKTKQFERETKEDGTTSKAFSPNEMKQFTKDLEEYKKLESKVGEIRGNNNKLFNELSEVIGKEQGKKITQESFTNKYQNDYMKIREALEDATYKLNYLQKESDELRDKERNAGRMGTAESLEKFTNKLQVLNKEKNLAKAEVIALSNALFLNEDITKKARTKEEGTFDKVVNVVKDLTVEGFLGGVSRELFDDNIDTQLNRARTFNNKLQEIGIDLGKKTEEDLKSTFSEKLGDAAAVSTILGGQIALTSYLTGGVGGMVRGAGLLPKAFELYDKGGKFKNIADIAINGLVFELSSDKTDFSMGVGEQGAQIAFDAAFKKLKPLNKVLNASLRTLVGASGVTFEEYAGDFFSNLSNSEDIKQAVSDTFGSDLEEGMEKFALTFTMGLASGGKQGAMILLGSYKEAKAKNPNSPVVKEMKDVIDNLMTESEQEKLVDEATQLVKKSSKRLYADGRGGKISAESMTVEQEVALREALKLPPLSEEELQITRDVKEASEQLPADSPYTSKAEMDEDLRILKGEKEEEGVMPNTYVGEVTSTDEGIVVDVTEKVEEGTQLRVPVNKLIVEETETQGKFDRNKAGVVDVWQDPETNEIFVVNGNKRVNTAIESDIESIDVNFIKANSLEEAKAQGELQNKLDNAKDLVEKVDVLNTIKNELNNKKSKIDYKESPIIEKGKHYRITGMSEIKSIIKNNTLQIDKDKSFYDNQMLNAISKASNIPIETLEDLNGVDNNKELRNLYNEYIAKPAKEKGEVVLSPRAKSNHGVLGFVKEGFFYDMKPNSSRYGSPIIVGSENNSNFIKGSHGSYNKDINNDNIQSGQPSALNKGFNAENFELWIYEKGKGYFKTSIKEYIDLVSLEDKLDYVSKKDLELNGLAKLNESLTTELKANPDAFKVLSVIGNNIAAEQQQAYYDFAKENKLNSDEVAQLVKETNLTDNTVSKVKLQTQQAKTSFNNATQLGKTKEGKQIIESLGIEPTQLYERVLSLSETAKKLQDKYVKLIASNVSSVNEANNRLNQDLLENMDVIAKEVDLAKLSSDAKKLTDAFSSEKPKLTDRLRDAANKLDGLSDKLSKQTYTVLLGVEPMIAKAFLKGLSFTLKKSATILEAIDKAIIKLQKTEAFKKKTAQEQADILAQLKSKTAEISSVADKMSARVKKQQKSLEQSVANRVKYLYKNTMTSLPTLSSLEKLAEKNGITDYKEFAKKLYADLQGFEKTREKNMADFEGAISDYITKGGGSVKSLFNTLTTLILKDKQSANTILNIIQDRVDELNKKYGTVKITVAQLAQIQKAITKADLSNLSGIYDVVSKIDSVISKQENIGKVSMANDLISSIKKKIRKDIPLEQKTLFAQFTKINPNRITSINELVDALTSIKEYLNTTENNLDVSGLQKLITKLQQQETDYITQKEDAINNQRLNDFNEANGTNLTLTEYLDHIKPLEDAIITEGKQEARENLRGEKRERLVKLAEYNLAILSKHLLPTNSSPIDLKAFNDLKKLIDKINNNELDGFTLDNLTDEHLRRINLMATEIIDFNSLASLNSVIMTIDGELSAWQERDLVKTAIRDFNNRIKSFFRPEKRNENFIGEYKKDSITLTQFFKRAFIGSKADSIGAKIYADLNYGNNIAKQNFRVFNQKLNKLYENRLSTKKSYDIGLKAYLLSSPEVLSKEDAQLLFEAKKRKIERDLEFLKQTFEDEGEAKSRRRGAKKRYDYQLESFESIKDIDNYQDLIDLYESGKLFDKSQAPVFELVKGEYEKQREQLIASNRLNGNKDFVIENNYTSIDYLKRDVLDEKGLENERLNSKHLNMDQSGTVLARLNPDNIKDILDFDFYNVSKNRVIENYIDLYTLGSRIKLNAFISSDAFKEAFNGRKDLHNSMIERIRQYHNSSFFKRRQSLDLPNNFTVISNTILNNMKKAILNKVDQIIKQPTVLIHSAIRFPNETLQATKLYLQLSTSKNGIDLLNDLLEGSDVSNRVPLGDESLSNAMSANNLRLIDLSERLAFINRGLKPIEDYTFNIGDFAMVKGDNIPTRITYIAALINTLKKEGKPTETLNDLLIGKSIENTFISDRLTSEINNESDIAKQGALFNSRLQGTKIEKVFIQLFFLFQSHAANAANAARSAMVNLFDSKTSREEKKIALQGVLGFVAAQVTFRVVSSITSELMGKTTDLALETLLDVQPDDEEKEKLFSENYNKYLAVNYLGDFFGGINPALVRESVVYFANKQFREDYKKENGKEYDGNLFFLQQPGKLSGSFPIAIDAVDYAVDIASPTLYKQDKNILESTEDMVDYSKIYFKHLAEQSTSKESLLEVLRMYSMFKGYGEPSRYFNRALNNIKKENKKIREVELFDFKKTFNP